MSQIKQKLNEDVKSAMLAGDAARVETLRGLKSVILYAEVAAGKRDQGLEDDEILGLFAREAKKRQESADLYRQGGAEDRAVKELSEKEMIEQYLPTQLSEAELVAIIDVVISDTNATDIKAMGQVMGLVKKQVGSAGDGALIARIVKEKLS